MSTVIDSVPAVSSVGSLTYQLASKGELEEHLTPYQECSLPRASPFPQLKGGLFRGTNHAYGGVPSQLFYPASQVYFCYPYHAHMRILSIMIVPVAGSARGDRVEVDSVKAPHCAF